MDVARPRPQDTVLDVGATNQSGYSANYLEHHYPWPDRITAAGIEPLPALAEAVPGISVRRLDGRTLPFPNASFDNVYSNAVLEHVGDAQAQVSFLAEIARVGRRVLFVTTPDRAFPIDSHTLVPLAHWLPPKLRDAVYSWLGVGAWVRGRLRLVTRRELDRLAAAAEWPSHHICSQRILGLPGVLMLSADVTGHDRGPAGLRGRMCRGG